MSTTTIARHVCTQEDPWTPDKGRRASHPDAAYVRDEDEGDRDVAVYDCPHCGLRFRVELTG